MMCRTASNVPKTVPNHDLKRVSQNVSPGDLLAVSDAVFVYRRGLEVISPSEPGVWILEGVPRIEEAEQVALSLEGTGISPGETRLQYYASHFICLRICSSFAFS